MRAIFPPFSGDSVRPWYDPQTWRETQAVTISFLGSGWTAVPVKGMAARRDA
jgi:hypothetical protein